MNKKEKVKVIQRILNSTFPHPKIPLDHKDPYTLLIAVLLSAQCTDKKVNEVTPLLFELASTPDKMAHLSIHEIQKIIKPCGLSLTKAKAIKKLSQMIMHDFKGQVPRTLDDLQKLPGVGRKTASVVLCQAFNQSAFPVDTHIHRCAKRWGLSSGKNVKTTEEDLRKLFPKKTWPKLHLQMIYYARKFCPAKAHTIETCPICKTLSQS